MSLHDVRPALQRDLALLEPELRADGHEVVMVAGDPPVAHVRVDVVDGHAHVERLAVGADLDGSIHRALLDAACGRLSDLGLDQVTAAPYAGPEVATYASLGFEAVPDGEPVPDHLVQVRGEPGRVLVRRALDGPQRRRPGATAVRPTPVRPGDEAGLGRPGSDGCHSRGSVRSCEDLPHD